MTKPSPVTAEDIDAQGVSCDLQFAARAVGVSRAHAYALVKEDNFPCRVIRVGSRYAVPTAALKTLLGL